jgi:hypothetical protein
MSSRTKLIAGTVAVAALAAAGAAFAAVELSSSSAASEPSVTTPFGQGISGSGLGGGRLGGRGLGGGVGAGEGGFRGGFGGRGFGGGGDAAAATYLGLSATALQTQLAGGKTLAEIAKTERKPVAGLIAVMLAAQKKRMASAVASGFLTDDQAQELEASMAARIKDLVNGARPRFGGGPDAAGGLGNGPGAAGGLGSSAGTGSFGSTS